ncbi:MAG: hypothetical protein IPH33_04760 [Bacteroidetes bacterium]|nr:hypothetical protein [Bacteroidota bacterium]
MAKSNDGGLIVCGEYDSNASVFKIDSLGIVQWAYQIGSSQIGKFSSIIRTNDSCYVLIGNITTSSSNKLDFYIVKIDPNGNVIWAKLFIELLIKWQYHFRKLSMVVLL